MLFKREHIKEDKAESAKLTAELILNANELMKYDAVSVGAYDLSMGIDYLLARVNELSTTFLSANLYDKRGRLLFKPTLIKKVGALKIGVIGLLDDNVKLDKIPDGRKLEVTDPYDTAEKLLPELRKEGADVIIILTDIKGGALRKLARTTSGIDFIIASDKRNRISLPVVVNNTHISHLDRGGKCVGYLEVLPAKGATDDSRGKVVGKYLLRNSFNQLRLEIPDDPRVAEMVKSAKAHISKAQEGEIADSGDDESDSGCGTRYVSAKTCKECHPGRFAWWKTTKHSNAMASLVAKQSQFNEECVMCHTLAYECDEGALSMGTLESFKNVQCESCHGPGELHVKSKGEQSMDPIPTRTTCLKCHTPERSPVENFDYRVKDICGEKIEG
ncbi:MAG: hypothetical protein C0609_09295 [Deltaproteobacteria bacterium]|nr:MAG: hypothetical protein C0609_09295 [Deltaproteobacteria bacterium]